jgi:uncharacterized protein YcbX
MNLTIETEEVGLVENPWMGKVLSIGGRAKVALAVPAPRCVMTTLAQYDLPKDPSVLKALGRHNRRPVGPLGELPCAGAYGVVHAQGEVRSGDVVALG